MKTVQTFISTSSMYFYNRKIFVKVLKFLSVLFMEFDFSRVFDSILLPTLCTNISVAHLR